MSVSGRNRRYMQAAAYTPRARRRAILDADLVARLDWILIGACTAIVLVGFLMIYSASRNIVSGDPTYFVKRQAFALTIGLIVAMVLLRIDYRKFRDFSLVGYVLTVAMLFFVLSPIGSASKGHQAWYQLPFGFQFQPSEFAKFGLIVALAGYVNEHRDEIDPWRLSVIVGLALIPIGLVQLQPDLGTNMVLIFAVIGLLAVAGVRGRYLLVLALLGMTLIFAVINVGILQKYQVDRLTSVFDTSAQAKQGVAYNQDQSKKTIGTGGFGRIGALQRAPRPGSGSSPSSRPTSSSPRSGRSSASSAARPSSPSSPSCCGAPGEPPSSPPTCTGRWSAPGCWRSSPSRCSRTSG